MSSHHQTDHRIRERIRLELERERITQTELASRLGIPHQHVSRMLGGARGRIPESLVRVLDALRLKIVVVPKEAGDD